MKTLKQTYRIVLLLIITILILACSTNNGQIDTGEISLPPGFKIEIYADVPNLSTKFLINRLLSVAAPVQPKFTFPLSMTENNVAFELLSILRLIS